MVGPEPDMVAVPLGAFADPTFPPPTRSVRDRRAHPWVALSSVSERHH